MTHGRMAENALTGNNPEKVSNPKSYQEGRTEKLC